MKKGIFCNSLLLLFIIHSLSFSQEDEPPLKIFGYFQTSFQHQKERISNTKKSEISTFNLQQLNLFFQRDITENWTTFINFEIFNNLIPFRKLPLYTINKILNRNRLGNNIVSTDERSLILRIVFCRHRR